AVDVIDCAAGTYLRSIPGLPRVAGALVSEAHDLVFTSNRAENTVGIFLPEREEAITKVKVGIGPNGLAYSAEHRLLLAANAGAPPGPGSFSFSSVAVGARALIADLRAPGRTRWAIFDPDGGRFYVNTAAPPQIVVVDSADPRRIAQAFAMPA